MKRKPETQLVPADVGDLREPESDPDADAGADEARPSPPPRRPRTLDPVANSAHLRADIVRSLADRASLEPEVVANVLQTWADLYAAEKVLSDKQRLILRKAEEHAKLMSGLRTQVVDWE